MSATPDRADEVEMIAPHITVRGLGEARPLTGEKDRPLLVLSKEVQTFTSSCGDNRVFRPPGPVKEKVSSTDTEMRINEQITIILRRHSAAVVEVYRHGVLVWKAGEPHSGVPRLSGDSAPSENR